MNSLRNSPLKALIGVDIPIIQAPMAGGATTPALVATVCEAGGLGCLGAGYMTATKIREDIRAVRQLTSRPFGVNLFVPDPLPPDTTLAAAAIGLLKPYHQELGLEAPELPNRFAEPFEKQIEAVIDERVPVFSFTFGIPDKNILSALKHAGTVIIGTSTTVDEGRMLVDAGVDAIVAQGVEAGGHRGTFSGDIDDALLGLVALVPQLVDAVSVPVVASGGIMDARGIVAALALGAVGAQLGTAFLTARESGINATYRRELLQAVDDKTQLTKAYSGRAARGIQTRFMTEMAGRDSEIPPYPVQNALTRDLRQAAAKTDRREFLSLWAGQAAALAAEHPAGEFVKSLADECDALLARLSGLTP